MSVDQSVHGNSKINCLKSTVWKYMEVVQLRYIMVPEENIRRTHGQNVNTISIEVL